jgi:two-component system sensor histidine kinase MprB
MIHTLKELRFALFMLALGGIAVAVGLGYGVALATIRPVERLTAAAEHVAATEDLDAAIDDEGNDEVSRLAQAFNAMLAALRSSRQQQAQLVSDAGHELRTPLTSLRTNIEVLVKVPDLPSDDRSGLLADVQSQVEELTTLVGDLVELGRHDENESERTEVGLHLIVERALDRARRRDIGMRFIVELEAGSVLAQPVLLERAVLNVLDNAVKFSPPGGPIEVTLRRSDHWVLDIGDHGRGISPEDLPKVFDRFYRAAAARSLPGSGLGLAIVAQVITDIGGRLSALRRSEGGTLIRIELPIVAEIEPGKSE